MCFQVRSAYATLFALTLLAFCGWALCQDAGPALPTITEIPGTGMSVAVMGGRPPSVMPPVPVTTAAGTPVLLQNVPSWTWCYGCANTAAAILFGYYDYKGYSKMFTGKENDGNPLTMAWPDTMADTPTVNLPLPPRTRASAGAPARAMWMTGGRARTPRGIRVSIIPLPGRPSRPSTAPATSCGPAASTTWPPEPG